MALPYIVLVDNNKDRARHLEIILQFMEFEVIRTDSPNAEGLISELNTDYHIFIGDGLPEQGKMINAFASRAERPKLVLIFDKNTALKSMSPINSHLFQVLEWPATFPVLKRITDKLSPPAETETAEEFASGAHRRAFTDRRGYDRRFCAQDRLKGGSRGISDIRKAIVQVAKTDATVLILGESGTGKEIIARAIHDASLRQAKLFVPINCGAIPAELLESELFGHEKGAFTGALGVRQGRFEMAEGGTLFLDEIGDMPMPMQVKLLRVLQERTFERVGSNKTIHCDVRVIAATHRRLAKEIKENRFREDLFYRLNVFPIEVTPLRERIEDIPELVEDIIACMENARRGSVRFTKTAVKALMRYDWPGNIRELANLIERMAIIYPDELVDVINLPEKFQQFQASDDEPGFKETDADLPKREEAHTNGINSASLAQLPSEGIDLKEYLNVLEEDLIRQALQESNGIVAHAAKRLNMRRTTLVEKLRKYESER